MTLLEKIKEKQLAARKAQFTSKAELYTTLLGEAQMVGKTAGNRESTDAEVLAVVSKFVKNIKDTLPLIPEDGSKHSELVLQLHLLNEFLPEKIAGNDLLEEVDYVKNVLGISTMKDVMNYFKQNHPGAYDGKELSNLLRN